MDHTDDIDGVAAAPAAEHALASSTTTTLPIIDESLHVDTVAVDRGGYRGGGGRAPAAGEIPVPRQDGDTWIVPVVEEVIVSTKQSVLVEEVRITRISGTHRDPQSVSLRKEHVEIERLGAEPSVIRSS